MLHIFSSADAGKASSTKRYQMSYIFLRIQEKCQKWKKYRDTWYKRVWKDMTRELFGLSTNTKKMLILQHWAVVASETWCGMSYLLF